MKTPVLRLVSCLVLLVAVSATARAGVLLTFDWSNLSAVKVTATSNAPAFSYNNGAEDVPVWSGGASSFKGEDGITFVNFLTSVSGTVGDVGPAATSSNLSDFSGNNILNQFYVLSSGQGGSGKDFNIYAATTSSGYIFANGNAAFTGEAVFNLSAPQYSTLVGLLPAQGSSGSLVMWNTTGYSLGTWSVTGAAAVPEPSTYALLLGLGALGVVAWRRRALPKRN